jgi:hypothetical protein
MPKKIQVSLKSDKSAHLWNSLAEFFLDWQMFQTEKINTCTLCSKTLPESRTVNEIMWKNTAEADRPKITICV